MRQSLINLDSLNLQFVMKLEKIYVYSYWYGGGWGASQGGFGKKIPWEEISDYLATYFMKSYMLEVTIYRE